MENNEEFTLERRLRQAILYARQRVYRVAKPTPLEEMALDLPFKVFIKREDLSPIKAYKWRGAYNRMALLSNEEKKLGVVAASAGNHAQGVALSARLLNTTARIFMPRSTPEVKQDAVRRHGGNCAEIVLSGDSYDFAVDEAKQEARESGKAYIHAFDDLNVMGGQGTLADEVVMSGEGPFDVAFLQIGGGGMAGAVACWLKTYYPEIKIIGVEGEQQASMAAAVKANKPVRLGELDIFSDGTAVRQAGDLSFEACREYIDEFMTVSNEELCLAIRAVWEAQRCIPEPAGAMGVAGMLQRKGDPELEGKRVLTVLCGANIDFGQLGRIATSTGVGVTRREFVRIKISERPGQMLALLKNCLATVNIIDFQYGKSDAKEAWPVFGLAIPDFGLEALKTELAKNGYDFADAGAGADVQFRVIPYRVELLNHPVILKLEFYERPGALRDFLSQQIREDTNLCYFNYSYTGERVGHALIGFEFSSEAVRASFLNALPREGEGYRSCEEVDLDVFERMTS